MRWQQDSRNDGAHRRSFDSGAFFTRALATSAEVFLHSRFGERYIGAPAAMALLIMVGFLAFIPANNPTPFLVFMASYLVACAAHRSAAIRRANGGASHSHYTGVPRLRRLMPGVAELTIKHRIEPILVFALGTLMIGPCKSLGLYWMAAGICMAANGVSFEAAEREQVNDMTDAFLDQRRLAEKLRERMRD